MAQIVDFDSDLVFAAALSEPLEQLSNRMLAFNQPLMAPATHFDPDADLFVLDLELPFTETRDLIGGTLRKQRETRSMAIVGLSRRLKSGDRLSFLHLGVDEIFEPDSEFEELQSIAEELSFGLLRSGDAFLFKVCKILGRQF